MVMSGGLQTMAYTPTSDDICLSDIRQHTIRVDRKMTIRLPDIQDSTTTLERGGINYTLIKNTEEPIAIIPCGNMHIQYLGEIYDHLTITTKKRTIIKLTSDIEAWVVMSYGNDRELLKRNEMRVMMCRGDNTIVSTLDGVNYRLHGNTIFTIQANSASYNPRSNIFIAAGRGLNTLGYSVDGVDKWFGLGDSIFSVSGNGVHHDPGTGITVAVGEGDGVSMAYSFDGVVWGGFAQPNILNIRGNDVCCHDGMWVAVGQGDEYSVVYSSDGESWHGCNTSSDECKCVSYLHGVWYVGGSGQDGVGQILRSTDGIKWDATAIRTLKQVNDIAYGSGKFVAVGEASDSGGSFITFSSDGRRWHSVPVSPDITGRGNAVWYDHIKI